MSCLTRERSSTTINAAATNGTVAVASTSESTSSMTVTHASRQYKPKASSAPAFSTTISNARTDNAAQVGATDSLSLPSDIAGQNQAVPHALLLYLRSWERHEIIALAMTREPGVNSRLKEA